MLVRLPALLCLAALLLAPPGWAQDLGDVSGLRAEALAAVNRDRVRLGRSPLRADDVLNTIAQAHADDMLRRNYYDHQSPEGQWVGDRYQAQGGSHWALVEENIYRCTGCTEAPDARRLQQAWMDSPGHRASILRYGLTGFGFGIAGVQGRVVYAVQTFAGPGVPRGTDAPEARDVLSSEAQVDLVLRELNAARGRAGMPPLQASRDLSNLARWMVSNDPEDVVSPAKMANFDALAGEHSHWQEVRLETARCGGCGVRPTAADVVSFAAGFLHEGAADANPLARDLDAAGFAIAVDGKGMKSVVLLLAQRR